MSPVFPPPAPAGVPPELIVLVDDTGAAHGVAEKFSSHHADTPLHLGFSCYIFDGGGRLLVTRRALSKKVWPGVWTNSLCGHPAPGETLPDAVRRRLAFELGMGASAIEVALPRFRYRTPPFRGVVENEFCPVLVARAEGTPRPNPDEVEEFTWMPWGAFCSAARTDRSDGYSWWCKHQLDELEDHELIAAYARPTSS